MLWVTANWWWLSWVLSGLVIPAALGGLKLVAMKTKNVHDDKIVTLLCEWWSMTRLFGKKH
jgi:hypothetical protein